MAFPRLGAIQNITMSGTSQQTTAFGTQTYMIRIATEAQSAYIAIGSNPTAAVATGILFPIHTIDYITVSPGEKLAVIQGGTAGVINVTECS